MFVTAIERASQFTRPIHSIVRFFGSSDVHPGAATMFFVNDDGWALTCRHVAQEIAASQTVRQSYQTLKAERAKLRGQKNERRRIRELEKQSGFRDDTPVELLHNLVNCIDGPLNLEARVHATLDIALLRFSGFTRLLCSSFPRFASTGTDLKPGKFLCRVGFPFAEFNNFTYDAASDQIAWTNTGRMDTPQFPLEGMVTRHLMGPTGITGFEMSTPGLRGQSGGPVFDSEGRVWGMQAATAPLDLNFDVDMQVIRRGVKKPVKESAILHVGHCMHVEALKDFMRVQGVTFQEG